jgi:hypothetical protein
MTTAKNLWIRGMWRCRSFGRLDERYLGVRIERTLQS